jgi:HlyD family secretion protein
MAANLHRDSKVREVDWRVVQRPPRDVIAESPSRGLIVQTVTAPGTVESVEEVHIGSQLIGRVVAIPVKDGDHVKRGEVLVKLEETDAKARLDSALARIDRLKASIAHATADLEKATRDLDNSSRLSARGAASRIEFYDARSVQAKASAALEMNRYELAEAEALRRVSQQELVRTEIRAPIDGVVSALNVKVGEVIIAGTMNLPGSVLMTISNSSRFQIRADVEETDVALVRPGQPARIYLLSDPMTPIPGVVDHVAPVGKKSDSVVSFETKVRLTGPLAGLRPAMTATVEFEVRRALDAMGVPVQAVVHFRRKDLPDNTALGSSRFKSHDRTPAGSVRESESQYVKLVFVVEDGIARARPVDVGQSDERRVEILSGLEPSDLVVVGPFRALDELRDGFPVKTAEIDRTREDKR